MEIESLAEYRSLLQRRNKESFFQRLKYSRFLQPTERKIIAAIFVCLILALTFIITTKIYKDKYSPTDGHNEEDILWNISTTAESELFMKLWNEANATLLNLRERLKEYENGGTEDIKNNTLSKWDQVSYCALILENVKRTLKKCVRPESLPKECKTLIWPPVYCSPLSRYRSINGSCNNLDHVDWGMSEVAFLRWLKPTYADDVSLPRQSVYGVPLPPVRNVSNNLFSRKTLSDSNTTMFFAHFGLFLDHDLVRSAQVSGMRLKKCCEGNSSFHHPACMEFYIPSSDPLYGPLNVSCHGFLRNLPTIGECPGRREQLNRMTSFIDASEVYGPTDEDAAKIRKFEDGQLRSTVVNKSSLLPMADGNATACFTEEANYTCFLSGDARVNMLMPLMTLHTLWFREHNRLAKELQALNPDWNDEKLFQEARRLLIAELQHVTYKEFLPIIFGYDRMKQFGLLIKDEENYDGYDKTVNPGLYNGFASAAFRFGHTLVQEFVELRDENYKLRYKFPLHHTYQNPSLLYNQGFDDIIRGMVGQNTQQTHRFTTEQIRGRLLQRYFMSSGFDLTSISIQRGRDHGIPPYVKWRAFCKLPVPKSWEDLYDIMMKEYVETLRDTYMSIEDIDLLPGGLGEYHVESALLGPTYICLLSKQFLALRKGDRFWFENPNQPGSFAKNQLKEIYKTSFARILCDNADELHMIQKLPFFVPSEENPVQLCENIPKIDMLHWKDI